MRVFRAIFALLAALLVPTVHGVIHNDKPHSSKQVSLASKQDDHLPRKNDPLLIQYNKCAYHHRAWKQMKRAMMSEERRVKESCRGFAAGTAFGFASFVLELPVGCVVYLVLQNILRIGFEIVALFSPKASHFLLLSCVKMLKSILNLGIVVLNGLRSPAFLLARVATLVVPDSALTLVPKHLQTPIHFCHK